MKRIFEIKFGEKSPIHIDIPETEEEKQEAKKKTKKVVVGGAIALGTLIAGGFGAKALYDRTHSNSDDPAALPDGNDDEDELTDPTDGEDDCMDEIDNEESDEESETENEEET